jgi:hypothetical protein
MDFEKDAQLLACTRTRFKHSSPAWLRGFESVPCKATHELTTLPVAIVTYIVNRLRGSSCCASLMVAALTILARYSLCNARHDRS